MCATIQWGCNSEVVAKYTERKTSLSCIACSAGGGEDGTPEGATETRDDRGAEQQRETTQTETQVPALRHAPTGRVQDVHYQQVGSRMSTTNR